MAKVKAEITDEEFYNIRKSQIESAALSNMEIYPNKYDVTHRLAEIKARASTFESKTKGGELVSCAGRVIMIREHGKLFFFDL